jgi:hypothetical protein
VSEADGGDVVVDLRCRLDGLRARVAPIGQGGVRRLSGGIRGARAGVNRLFGAWRNFEEREKAYQSAYRAKS